MVERRVEGFTFGWLVDEIAPQLYKELDFENEAGNGRKAKQELAAEFGCHVVVPSVHVVVHRPPPKGGEAIAPMGQRSLRLT